MIRFLLICIFFLASCSSYNTKDNINFSDQMSFEEFRKQLEEYAKNSPYPKIDG
tara:strand:+ start:114 stop:275 length:162 start_codon:yes stop_codon:yes gene_type:complete